VLTSRTGQAPREDSPCWHDEELSRVRPIEMRQFTRPEIDREICKLRWRIEELSALDSKQIRYDGI
jgi:hypothetical protein